jgi:hypothetical protein
LRRLALLVLIVALLAACGEDPVIPSASVAIESSVVSDATPEPAPAESSVDVGPDESPVFDPPMAEPPAASVAVEGGDPVIGQLGTFTWQNGGSDAPWLDGERIHVGLGEQLFMALAEPVALGAWSVSRVTPGNRDGSGEVPMAEGPGGIVRFAAPPAGTWSVRVRAAFAGNLGSASYYWLIQVD